MKLKYTSVYISLYFNFMGCFRLHRSYGKGYSPFYVRFAMNLGLVTTLNDLLGFQEAWRNFPAILESQQDPVSLSARYGTDDAFPTISWEGVPPARSTGKTQLTRTLFNRRSFHALRPSQIQILSGKGSVRGCGILLRQRADIGAGTNVWLSLHNS